MQCTDAEVVLVTMLLYGRVQHSFDFNGWATAVLAETAAFVPGKPWSATGSQLATARNELESRLPGLKPSRVAVVATAATKYDGAGRAAAPYTRAQFNNYLGSLLASPKSSKVWLGVSHAGCNDVPHGATLRHAYIMPLVARLWRDEAARIRRAFEAACVARCETLPAKTPASATKVCSGRPSRHRARAACGSRLFEIELKVALAGKESAIAEKNEIVTTARADTARARNALRTTDGDSAPSGMPRRARRDGAAPRRHGGERRDPRGR